MEKGKIYDIFILHSSKHLNTIPFLLIINEESHYPISIIKKSLHKSQFLQKLSCQKPYWDHARLSSLVNKHVISPVIHSARPSYLPPPRPGMYTRVETFIPWMRETMEAMEA